MRKLMALGFAALLVLALTSAAAATGKGGPADRIPSTREIPTVEPQIPQLTQLANQLERVGGAGYSCTTISCLNKAINKQQQAIGKVQNGLEDISSMMYQCLLFAPITAYGDMENYSNGYLWWDAADPDYFYISSALDFTWGEDPVHAWTWVWDMESCPL